MEENIIKVSEEELQKVKKIQEEYFKIQEELGYISISKIRIDNQIKEIDKNTDSLHKKFEENQSTELNLIESMTEKYGRGTLNSETGVFTKNNS